MWSRRVGVPPAGYGPAPPPAGDRPAPPPAGYRPAPLHGRRSRAVPAPPPSSAAGSTSVPGAGQDEHAGAVDLAMGLVLSVEQAEGAVTLPALPPHEHDAPVG